jgi:hypothetical protein
MRTFFQVWIIASVAAPGNCEDALTVIDLIPSQDQVVESAPIAIPEGYEFSFSMHSGNNDATKADQQGARIQYSGISFTVVTGVDDLNQTNPFPNTTFVRTRWGSGDLGRLVGPATLSVFASGAPARAHLYVYPTKEQVMFLVGEDSSHVVPVPANSAVVWNADWRGLLAASAAAVTASGVTWRGVGEFSEYPRWQPYTNNLGKWMTNKARYAFPDIRSGSSSVGRSGQSLPSAAFPGLSFALTGSSGWFQPASSFGSSIVGPATVTFRPITNDLTPHFFGVLSYTLYPVNASYPLSGSGSNGDETTNSPTNTNSARSLTLQLQRSTNLSDWETADNYYINETSDKAFYRLKPVAP